MKKLLAVVTVILALSLGAAYALTPNEVPIEFGDGKVLTLLPDEKAEVEMDDGDTIVVVPLKDNMYSVAVSRRECQKGKQGTLAIVMQDRVVGKTIWHAGTSPNDKKLVGALCRIAGGRNPFEI